MKKFLTLIIMLGVAFTIQAQDITNTPGTNGDFIINSTTGGLLIPRVDIADLSTAAPVTTPATSLLVYNTNTTTGPGFFYWDGSAWVNATGAKELDDLSDAKSDGFYSLYLGHSAGENATSATSRNVGVGPFALRNATGKWNVGVGRSAGTALTTGEENTFLGFASGDKVNSGTNNTLVGSNCGYTFTSGSYNTFIGSHSGFNATGSSNILIGYDVEPSSTSANNELNIANSIYATGLYTTSPKIGIGHQDHFGTVNNDPNSTLTVTGSVSMAFEQGGNVTLDDTHYTYFAENGAVITLPGASTCPGRVYIIKALGSSGATINAKSGETIDGVSSKSLAQYDYIKVQSVGGTNWWIIGEK